MADSSGQVAHFTSQPAPSNAVAAPTVVRLDSPDHVPAGPFALAAVSGNAGTTPSTTGSTQQDAAPKPVFKMKRTGSANLPQATPIRDPSEELEPARVISDILPLPQSFATPTSNSSAPTPNSNSASDATRKTKYATDEERRRATSIALKKRWASGRMDQVHKKRIETIRRRKEEEALLGTSGITKPLGPVGTPKHANKSSASPNRIPRLLGLTTSPAHHARKRTVVSEQLARLFEDRPMATESASLVPLPRPRSDFKKPESTRRTVWSTSSDFEMSETSPPPGRHGSSNHSNDGQASEKPNDEDDNEKATKDSPFPLELAAPDRPYTKWKDAKGSLKLTHGALIPEGYALSTTTPKYPWICPIRSCRKVFVGLVQLGGHFVRAHRGARLHDNEDGTLSVRSQALLRRGAQQGSTQKQTAIVVSRGPADPSEPPAVAPSYPTSVLRDSTLDLHDLTTVEAEVSTNASTSATPSGQELDQEPGLNGDAQEFWSYLQPYLIKHKGPVIPLQGWVRRIITLPRVRDLDWNEPWLATHPYTDTHPRDISALILQATGDPAPTPCGKCLEGKGPFRSCIMISSKAEAGPLGAILSCANCFYHFNQTYCTHKKWGTERRNRILKARDQGEPFDGLLKDFGVGEESEDADIEEHEGDTLVIDDDNMEYTMNDSTTATPLMPGGTPAGFNEAESGRPYDMWPDENGQLAPMFGALLPVGYQLDTTIPGRPWICPVRTCRKAHCKRSDLGYHFQRIHFAANLNDNCDGTFSIKGVYRSKVAAMGKGAKILTKAPPIVVSKEPWHSASPIPKAQLPTYLATRPPPPEVFEAPEVKSTRKRTLGGSTAADLWAYIQPHLITTTSMPKAPVIRHLLAVPRQRDLQYNLRGTRFYEMGFRDIAAMLIQITGDVPPDSCTRCRKGKGPFQGCVVMPQSAHLEAKERYPCCANCVYGGKKLHCSLMRWVQEKTGLVEEASDGDQSSHAMEAFPAPETSSRVGKPQPASRHYRDLPLRRSRRQEPNPRLTGSPAISSCRPGPSALISQGTFQGQGHLLEMEDWEIAPGRIRETVAAETDTIAFSKPYLSTAAQAVPVCDDVAFRVDTVSAGNALRLEADAGKTRLCAVAAGKVRVEIGEEAEFVVGPHGMFKVKAGVACTVRNGLYLDAVLHTTVLMGFS